MSLSYVASLAGTSNTVTLPSFQGGDIALLYAYRDGSLTPPSAVEGFTSVLFSAGPSGGLNNSRRLSYRVLATTDTTFTSGNTTDWHIVVLRGQSALDPIGATGTTFTTSTTIVTPAVTLESPGASGVVAFAGAKTATNVNVLELSETTNRSGTNAAMAAHTAFNPTEWLSRAYHTLLETAIGLADAVEILPETRALEVSSFTPTSGLALSEVTITGINFVSVSDVKFNGTSVQSFTQSDSTTLVAVVPPGATTGKINVTTADGNDDSSTDFTITPTPAPSIESISPFSGQRANVVTIRGDNLTDAGSVTFNGTESPNFIIIDDHLIYATVPSGATTGAIAVVTEGGTAESDSFTVSARNTVTVSLATDGTDVTTGFQAMVDAAPDGTLFDLGSNFYRCETGLFFNSRHDLAFVNGTIYVTAPGEVGGNGRSDRPHLSFRYCTGIALEDIRIVGVDTTSSEGYEGYATYRVAYEAEHGFRFLSTDDVTMFGCSTHGTYGDGVAIGQALNPSGGPCTGILINDVNVSWNGRQGLSIVHADGVEVNELVVTNSRRSGVDLEPNRSTNFVRNVIFRGGELNAWLLPFSAAGTRDTSYITLDGVHFGGSQTILSAAGDPAVAHRTDWTVRNCTRTVSLGGTDGHSFGFARTDNIRIVGNDVQHSAGKSQQPVKLTDCDGTHTIVHNDFSNAELVYEIAGTTPTPLTNYNTPTAQDVAFTVTGTADVESAEVILSGIGEGFSASGTFAAPSVELLAEGTVSTTTITGTGAFSVRVPVFAGDGFTEVTDTVIRRRSTRSKTRRIDWPWVHLGQVER